MVVLANNDDYYCNVTIHHGEGWRAFVFSNAYLYKGNARKYTNLKADLGDLSIPGSFIIHFRTRLYYNQMYDRSLRSMLSNYDDILCSVFKVFLRRTLFRFFPILTSYVMAIKNYHEMCTKLSALFWLWAKLCTLKK